MRLELGTPAPDFTLRDQHGQSIALSSYRGRKAVVVMFYPFAFSSVCTGELSAVRDDLSDFESDAVQVLAISCDPVYSLRVFAERDGLTFPLLSDFWPHGAIAQTYGVFNEKAGMALRATFLLDADGVVTFAQVNQPGDAREQSAWKDAVGQLAA